MNELIEHTIRKFNPGVFQSDEEVTRQFVVRKCEFDIVREILHGNVDSPSCEHVLLVAPRGRGKTTLLARVGAELRTDIEFSKTLLPIRFMEESQEIFDPADFWLETLFYLAREVGGHDSELSRELQATHAELARDWRGNNLEERARATVLDASDRLGRRLVLMVENLQALCENVDSDFGWKLRGTLQTEPQIILVATATGRFKGLDDAKEPFFELFRIICLEPLDTGECRRLWQMVSGDSVSERAVRPLEILTGGNPRLLVIIGEFARHRSLRRLMEELVKLIDDHTEYFRAHLDGFAKTERRVYLAVIDLWQQSTTGEIAARARMDVRAVSALLGRLVERGAVLTEGSGRKRTYVAAERLYSIYYKLRRERDEAAVVRNLIHFMAAFYSEAELSVSVGEVQAAAGDAEEALRTCDEIERDLDAMTGDEKITFQWQARRIRTKALLALEHPAAAIDAFRSAYAAFDPGDEAMMRELLAGVSDWVAAGASERDLVEILSNDSEKAGALQPLVVALRQRTGEAVRAPGEVLEVAADIRERIEAKVNAASLRTPSA